MSSSKNITGATVALRTCMFYQDVRLLYSFAFRPKHAAMETPCVNAGICVLSLFNSDEKKTFVTVVR